MLFFCIKVCNVTRKSVHFFIILLNMWWICLFSTGIVLGSFIFYYGQEPIDRHCFLWKSLHVALMVSCRCSATPVWGLCHHCWYALFSSHCQWRNPQTICACHFLLTGALDLPLTLEHYVCFLHVWSQGVVTTVEAKFRIWSTKCMILDHSA